MNKWLLLATFAVIGSTAAASPWNQFGVKMEKELPAEKSGVYSPLSIWIAMAMVEAGAEKQTKTELRNVLGMGSLTAPQISEQLRVVSTSKFYEIGVANAMWPSAGHMFDKTFTANLQKNFGAELTPLDYAKDAEGSRLKVNAWVEKKTNQKIRTLLAKGTVTPATRFILTNAIYFKGNWDIPFNKYATRDGQFEGGGKIPLMNNTDFYAYYEDTKVQALRMEYEGDQMYFLVILPKAGKPLAEGNPLRMEAIRDKLISKRVVLTLPRFKIETELAGLTAKLKRLGIVRIFDPAKSELTKIGAAGQAPLVVSDVIHKAMIEVNEAGTEAAAATAVVAKAGAAPQKETPPVQFTADRPFRFYIIHRATKSVLFSGQYFGD